MVTKNLVHIESIDVGAVPLVSSHSYVQSVGFRLYRPLFLFPDAGRFAIGDPRSAPPNQCAAEVAARACSPEDSRPRLWTLLMRLWSGWRCALAMVRPETVIAWHRKGFQLYWTWKGRWGRPGRPPVSREVRDLIRKMCLANPLWGAPRIHGEILKLGIELSQHFRMDGTTDCRGLPLGHGPTLSAP